MFFGLGTGEALNYTFQPAGFSSVQVTRTSKSSFYGSAEGARNASFAGGLFALAYSKFDEKTRPEYLDTTQPCRTGIGYERPGEFVLRVSRRDN